MGFETALSRVLSNGLTLGRLSVMGCDRNR